MDNPIQRTVELVELRCDCGFYQEVRRTLLPWPPPSEGATEERVQGDCRRCGRRQGVIQSWTQFQDWK